MEQSCACCQKSNQDIGILCEKCYFKSAKVTLHDLLKDVIIFKKNVDVNLMKRLCDASPGIIWSKK